ncbi:ALP1-like protein isoform X1 [Tanacetum coccineum]
MMSDSSGGDLSDIDDFDDLEMIMQQVQVEQEEEEEAERVCHRNYIYRERIKAEERLKADYFGPNPKYPLYYFRKRARPDATGLPGFSVIMKCTCAIRQLAYGVTPDSLNEYLQMGNHCSRDCLDFFTMCVIELFMPEYLRKPDFNDIQNLYTAHNNIHGFPGMLESIDCMHWEWRNCPKGWHGQFARAGANNDLTVLNNSPLFDDLLDDIAPMAPFECNGVTFEKGYYLADDIYPQWSSFVKSFTVANSEKNALFKWKQESARKDVERAFGVLQGRWHIICQPARAWTVNKLRRVMYTCIILHNMILKDQKFALSEFEQQSYICPQPNILRTWIERCEVQRRKSKEPCDKQTHAKFQRNVIEHLWQQHQQHQQQD